MNDELKTKDELNSDEIDLSLDWEEVFAEGIDIPQEISDDGDETGINYTISIPDSLIISLSNKGKVDMPYMCELTGEDVYTIIDELYGSIFQDPCLWDCGDIMTGWVTKDEYLSGNLARKLKYLKEDDFCYPHLKKNVEAIEKVIPTYIPANDIYVTLGSPWVPLNVIREFVLYLLHKDSNSIYRMYGPYISHDEITGSWHIDNKNAYPYLVNVTDVYGTKRLNALEIIERCLNMRSVAVYDTVKCTTTKSGEKKVLNKVATLEAQDRQRKILNLFQQWISENDDVQEQIEKIFWERFGTSRRRIFDGSFLTFPDMSMGFELYPYQKNAVARIIFSKNTLLAHDVGAGKTYVMVAAGMELKRMGISKKNLFVVPNNIVGQWESIFKMLYPGANILVVDPKVFKPEKRQDILKDIRDNDYDGIIMAYSCFDMLRVSNNFKKQYLRDRISTLKRSAGNYEKSTPTANAKLRHMINKLSELEVEEEYEGMCFDELGITRLFVDEAHNYKNVPIDTKIENVLGISSRGSAKCVSMVEKVHSIQRSNNGGGVIFATGTPITNSITDAYVMQYYLQSGELAMMDIEHFDGWVGMFAEKNTEFEIDVDTSNYRLATRFSRFHNLPELASLLSSIADFHQMDNSDGVPEINGYQDVTLERSNELSNYLREITRRAEAIRAGQVKRSEDNMLKITTDGRKAALDIRLVEENTDDDRELKVAMCADKVFEIYKATEQNKSTQLVFCDYSTPKEGFNIYDDLRERLIRLGVNPNDIAFIHDAKTEKSRNDLYKYVRAGEVRILIGSTAKLGLGVNVQDKLIALHHLDVPWRPADMTQREGRILRQGNENSRVFIYRYITKGSFDAYSWQLLETKQSFITGILSGFIKERSGSNIEDTVLNYAEVKALAIGNPLIKERVVVANELARYTLLQKKLLENKERLERELIDIGPKMDKYLDWMEKCSKDIGYYEACKTEHTVEDRTRIGALLSKEVPEYEYMDKEKELLEYQGFKVVLPAHMDGTKPYVYVRNNGNYMLETSLSDIGNVVRLDNVLNGLSKRLENFEKQYKELVTRKKGIEDELSKDADYTQLIERYSKRIVEIDERLGVNKNEHRG